MQLILRFASLVAAAAVRIENAGTKTRMCKGDVSVQVLGKSDEDKTLEETSWLEEEDINRLGGSLLHYSGQSWATVERATPTQATPSSGSTRLRASGCSTTSAATSKLDGRACIMSRSPRLVKSCMGLSRHK